MSCSAVDERDEETTLECIREYRYWGWSYMDLFPVNTPDTLDACGDSNGLSPFHKGAGFIYDLQRRLDESGVDSFAVWIDKGREYSYQREEIRGIPYHGSSLEFYTLSLTYDHPVYSNRIVDTLVYSRRLGIVRYLTPGQTEYALLRLKKINADGTVIDSIDVGDLVRRVYRDLW